MTITCNTLETLAPIPKPVLGLCSPSKLRSTQQPTSLIINTKNQTRSPTINTVIKFIWMLLHGSFENDLCYMLWVWAWLKRRNKAERVITLIKSLTHKKQTHEFQCHILKKKNKIKKTGFIIFGAKVLGCNRSQWIS